MLEIADLSLLICLMCTVELGYLSVPVCFVSDQVLVLLLMLYPRRSPNCSSQPAAGLLHIPLHMQLNVIMPLNQLAYAPLPIPPPPPFPLFPRTPSPPCSCSAISSGLTECGCMTAGQPRSGQPAVQRRRRLQLFCRPCCHLPGGLLPGGAGLFDAVRAHASHAVHAHPQ